MREYKSGMQGQWSLTDPKRSLSAYESRGDSHESGAGFVYVETVLLDQKLPVWLSHLHENLWFGHFCTSLKECKESLTASVARVS